MYEPKSEHIYGRKHRKCKTRKICFSRKKRALTSANMIQSEKQKYLRTYKCRHCKSWHLTSQPPKPKKK